MTSSIGWILAVAIVLWSVAAQRLSHRKRRHLRHYAIYLLLDDQIRDDHKAKLEEWVRKSGANDAMQLSLRACNVIENMADSLAEHGSSLGAHSMLWNSDAAVELRKSHGSVEMRVPP